MMMNQMKHQNFKIELSGKVIHGDSYGKILGFPTANLDRREYVRKKMKIRLGVWAGRVRIDANNKLYKAGITIGLLDKKGLIKIEAYLIGFQGNLYGQKINLYFDKYLRPLKRFKNADALKSQVEKDIIIIKKIIK